MDARTRLAESCATAGGQGSGFAVLRLRRLTLLDAVAELAPGELFLNPGTHTPELIAAAEALGIRVRVGCSIVAEGFSPGEFGG